MQGLVVLNESTAPVLSLSPGECSSDMWLLQCVWKAWRNYSAAQMSLVERLLPGMGLWVSCTIFQRCTFLPLRRGIIIVEPLELLYPRVTVGAGAIAEGKKLSKACRLALWRAMYQGDCVFPAEDLLSLFVGIYWPRRSST